MDGEGILDLKTQAFIAIGASTAADCTGCLERTVSMAKGLGIEEEDIEAAIEIGKRVKAGAEAKPDPFAMTSRYHAFEISRMFSFHANEGSGGTGGGE